LCNALVALRERFACNCHNFHRALASLLDKTPDFLPKNIESVVPMIDKTLREWPIS
jgi:hypothetical protein